MRRQCESITPRNWAPSLTAAHDPELAVIAVRAVVALTPVPFADYVFSSGGGCRYRPDSYPGCTCGIGIPTRQHVAVAARTALHAPSVTRTWTQRGHVQVSVLVLYVLDGEAESRDAGADAAPVRAGLDTVDAGHAIAASLNRFRALGGRLEVKHGIVHGAVDVPQAAGG